MAENGIVVSKPQNSALNMFADKESFNTGYTMAKVLAESTIVPPTFKGNVGNAMIAIDMAQRMHTNPLMVMQNLYIVHNQPAWSAKFLVACINASGLFATPLRYEFVGTKGTDDWGCYAFAIDKQGEVLKGSTVTMGIARASGWLQKKDSMWQKEPEQMLRYRAATRFQTAYCPEISCGLSTKEDLEDAQYTEITSENIDKLSEQNKLAQAQAKEQTEANTQSLDMTGVEEGENKPSDKQPSETQKTTEKGEDKAQTKAKAQPMGKQEMPDMFK